MTAFAQRQRVEVGRTLGGVPSFDVATVVDLPREDLVRVRLDTSPDIARLLEPDLIRSIPDAVSRHITRLIEALGAVSDDERAAVDEELHRRLMTNGNLIDFARRVAESSDSVADAVRGLSL